MTAHATVSTSRATGITGDGWNAHAVWENSAALRDLYTRRARDEAEEMTCAAQAAELLAPHVTSGDLVLDAGCGSGYFYHSLRRRSLSVRYVGIDASPALIAIGQRELPAFGLPATDLRVLRIEDLNGTVDHTICLNVLSNLDNYHRPLERLLACTRQTVILRESCSDTAVYRYVTDHYLDPGCELRVHVNTYPLEAWTEFIEAQGFDVERHVDRRTGGAVEMIIDHPHHWTFFVARRRTG